MEKRKKKKKTGRATLLEHKTKSTPGAAAGTPPVATPHPRTVQSAWHVPPPAPPFFRATDLAVEADFGLPSPPAWPIRAFSWLSHAN